jgi:hypothetical protein
MTVIDIEERRKAGRASVLATGLIRFGDTSMCCVIRNISSVGAALDIGSRAIPDQFTLIVPGDKIYSCTVVWWKERHIGVAFSQSPIRSDQD